MVHRLSLLLRDERSGTSARNDGQQVVPSTDDSTGVALNQFLQRDRHFLLDGARIVHVPRDVEQLRAGIPRPSKRDEPIPTTTTDRLTQQAKSVLEL